MWHQILDEISFEVNKNPLCRALIGCEMLESSSLEEALAINIAVKLTSEIDKRTILKDIFLTILKKDSNIAIDSALDLLEIKNRDFSCTSIALPFFFSRGYLALQSYRMAHHLHVQGEKILSAFVHSQTALNLGVDINPAALISREVVIDHGIGLVIGSTSIIENNVYIFHNVTLGSTGKKDGKRHPNIRKGAVIGAASSILGDIEIGEGAVVAAGSIVLSDVPPYKTVAGNPAKIVGDAQPLLQTNARR